MIFKFVNKFCFVQQVHLSCQAGLDILLTSQSRLVQYCLVEWMCSGGRLRDHLVIGIIIHWLLLAGLVIVAG